MKKLIPILTVLLCLSCGPPYGITERLTDSGDHIGCWWTPEGRHWFSSDSPIRITSNADLCGFWKYLYGDSVWTQVPCEVIENSNL